MPPERASMSDFQQMQIVLDLLKTSRLSQAVDTASDRKISIVDGTNHSSLCKWSKRPKTIS